MVHKLISAELPRHDHSFIACSRHIGMVMFFTHIPFVVNHTINATPPERLQQYQQSLWRLLLQAGLKNCNHWRDFLIGAFTQARLPSRGALKTYVRFGVFFHFYWFQRCCSFSRRNRLMRDAKFVSIDALYQGWAISGPRATCGPPQRFQWPVEAFRKDHQICNFLQQLEPRLASISIDLLLY